MTSPFPPSTSTPGTGRLTTVLLPNGHTHLSTITYQYPLKLISPPRNTQSHLSALVFLLSYGGGLVGGDTISLHITVVPGSRLAVVTQGHTKIFRSGNPSVTTRQELDVLVGDGAALCLLPDPVQPFAHSVYAQAQTFRLRGPDASLCLLDWVTQGRGARGEDWDLTRWHGRNEVWWSASASASVDKGRLLVRDTVKLDNKSSPGSGPNAGGPPVSARTLRDTMHGSAVFGTLILRGPLVRALGAFFLSEFAALPRIGARDWGESAAGEEEEKDPHEVWRAERLRLEKEGNVLWSAAGVRGCVVVKFGAATVEAGRVWIGDMLTREGSVARCFGDQALMCVR